MVELQDPDLKIVELAQQGSAKAFDLLVLKYQGRIMALISRFISDRGLVEDVAQESFIKAYRSINTFKGNSLFYTWLYRVAVNTAKNALSYQGRRVPFNDIAVGTDHMEDYHQELHQLDNPESHLISEQLKETLDIALSALPAELQQAFQFREFDGLSYEQIAILMETPIGTVRSRIFRARSYLETSISEMMNT